MSPPTIYFRKDLQGLRGIAVLAVVFAHAALGFAQGGFIGVDIFFILSGFLISQLLFAELEKNGHIRFIHFYARRFKRLLPALLALLLAITAAALILLSDTEAKHMLASAPFVTFWTSNFYFSFSQVDYFNELASHDLFLHTWSLAVEEQFYLIWPILLLLLFTYSKQMIGKRFIIGLLIISVISFAISLYWSKDHTMYAYYLMPARIWQFALGALAAIIIRRTSEQANKRTSEQAFYSI